MININIDLPNWTDIVQACAAAIAVPLTILTLYKLVKKDKARESEVQSLADIASELSKITLANEKRQILSKKPIIKIDINEPDEKRITVNFINSNVSSSLIDFKCNVEEYYLKEFSITKFSINTSEGNQFFSIGLTFKNSFTDFIYLKMNYITEEGFEFIQDISLIRESGFYKQAPNPIVQLNEK